MQLPRGTSRKRLIPYATAPAFTLVAMCLIGTKTAFIGVGAAVAAPFVFALVEFFRKKDRTLLEMCIRDRNYPECTFTLAEHFRKKKLTKTNVKELLEGKETLVKGIKTKDRKSYL